MWSYTFHQPRLCLKYIQFHDSLCRRHYWSKTQKSCQQWCLCFEHSTKIEENSEKDSIKHWGAEETKLQTCKKAQAITLSIRMMRDGLITLCMLFLRLKIPDIEEFLMLESMVWNCNFRAFNLNTFRPWRSVKKKTQYWVEFLIYEENFCIWYELGCWGRKYKISFYFNEKLLLQQDYMESEQQPQWDWYQLPYLLSSAQKEWKKWL